MSLLVISEIWECFFSIDDSKHSLRNKETFLQPIHYLINEKNYLNSLLLLLNLHQVSNIFLKKMSLIAGVFWKLQNAKGVAR